MGKRNVVGFNLTEEEEGKLDEICSRTGLKRVEIFRQRVLEQDSISKQFTGLNDELENKFAELAENLDKSIEWNLSQNLENVESKISDIVDKKLATIEDRIVKLVVQNIKDLTANQPYRR